MYHPQSTYGVLSTLYSLCYEWVGANVRVYTVYVCRDMKRTTVARDVVPPTMKLWWCLVLCIAYVMSGFGLMYECIQCMCAGIRNRRLQSEALQHLLQLLPVPNRDTLWVLLSFLAQVAKNSEDHKDNAGS